MRLAILTDTFQPGLGGLTSYVRQQARHLSERGHDVRVFAWASDRLAEADFALCRAYPAAPFVPAAHLRLGAAPVRMLRDVAAFGPEVVHNHSQFGMGWHAAFVARRLRVPLVSHCHYVLEGASHFLPAALRRAAPFARWFMRRHTVAIYQRADLVLTPSAALRRYLAGIGVTRPIEVVPIGVAIAPPGPAVGEASPHPRPFTALAVGRLSAEKDFPFLLGAFARLARDHRPDARLEVVGDGVERPMLETLAARLGVADRTTFHGWIDPADLPGRYAAADVFVTACACETFGMAVLEAFAHGLPVVAPAAMALPELVRDGGNGALFRPGDLDGAVAALAALADDPDRRRALAEGARRTAARYERGAMFARLTRVLEEARAAARRHGGGAPAVALAEAGRRGAPHDGRA